MSEHDETPWTGPPAGDSVLKDALAMVEALQRSTAHGPFEMYLPDSGIIAMGGDPNDWPELEGHPGVRVVRGK